MSIFSNAISNPIAAIASPLTFGANFLYQKQKDAKEQAKQARNDAQALADKQQNDLLTQADAERKKRMSLGTLAANGAMNGFLQSNTAGGTRLTSPLAFLGQSQYQFKTLLGQ